MLYPKTSLLRVQVTWVKWLTAFLLTKSCQNRATFSKRRLMQVVQLFITTAPALFYIEKLDPGCATFQCPHCSQVCKLFDVSEPLFLITFDVRSQLQKLLKAADFLDLTEPLVGANPMCDITDGSMYCAFVNNTAQAGHTVSATLNADGAPVFKSSSTAIWSIQLSVNEIPPKERMNKLV